MILKKYKIIVVFCFSTIFLFQNTTLRAQTINVYLNGRITGEFTMPTSNFIDPLGMDGAWLFQYDFTQDSTDFSLLLDFQINQTNFRDTIIVYISLYQYYDQLISSNNFDLLYDPEIFSSFEYAYSTLQNTNGILITAVPLEPISQIAFEIILTNQNFLVGDYVLYFNVYTNIPRGTAAYFPLMKGNIWEYNEYTPSDSTYADFQYEITDSLFIVNQSRYEVKKSRLTGNKWIIVSIDTIRIDNENNILNQDDDFYFPILPPQWIFYQYDYIKNEQLLSKVMYVTEYHDPMPGYESEGFTVTNIGTFDLYVGQLGFPPYMDVYLLGAKINGAIVYGTITDIEPFSLIQPTNLLLYQNYPNPFNPSTKIIYQIPEISFVTLKVYDILGREVATLVNEEKPAGSYEVQFSSNSVKGRNLTSGIYFYQLKAGEYTETKKMILIK